MFPIKIFMKIGSMTFALATIAPKKYLHANPNLKSTHKQNPNHNPKHHIKLNLLLE